MSVTATNNNSSVYPDTTASSTVAARKTTLGSDDFLKLLSVQFQSQDPMKPMEDTAFIAQMAQFTALEQSNTMSSKITELLEGQNLATANSYIDRQVTIKDADDNVVKGKVDGVEVASDGPRLVVGSYTYPLSSVVAVEPAPAPTPAPADTPTS